LMFGTRHDELKVWLCKTKENAKPVMSSKLDWHQHSTSRFSAHRTPAKQYNMLNR
jgi:hypothetical protein